MADNPFLPTFGTTPPTLAGRDDVVARFERAFERGPQHPDYTIRRRLIDAGAIESADRGKVRFSYRQMGPWLRSQR